MAHKKAGGSTAWGRDSHGKRLGVKIFEGALANAGNIIVRQRGTKFHPGKNVRRGADDTLYSAIEGLVHFTHRKALKFDGKLKTTKIISVFARQDYDTLKQKTA